VAPRPDSAQQKLLGRYLKAWEGDDLDGFIALLKEDAILTMPPWREWYAGRQAIRSFFERVWKRYKGFRLVATAANAQPAFAVYTRTDADAPWDAHAINVLTLEHDMISTATFFVKPAGPHLFQAFGLPLVLPGAASAGLPS
jgi:RNA polymerase sigma-70 factor (ECF subfamily)